jgi:hypothetical protein
MYQISRAIYRELSGDVAGGREAHERVLRACEHTVERMVADRHYFARPARALFHDVRPFLALPGHGRAWHAIEAYVCALEQHLQRLPPTGVDPYGRPVRCRATTRRGTPCQRVPLHPNGYCPSHQHLAETEEVEAPAGEPLAA